MTESVAHVNTRAHAVTRCATLVELLVKTTNGVACSYSDEAVWKGEQGYACMTGFMKSLNDTRHYEPAFNLPWWLSAAPFADNTTVFLQDLSCFRYP